MDSKDKQISEYKARIADLEQQVADLTEKLSLVLSQLSKQAIKKNSRNSSLPPSQDKGKESIKRTSSLREKSTRSSGGQPGHKGSTLKMTPEPDTYVDLKPKFCNCCGQAFPEDSLSYKKSRQVVDIPLSPAVTTEYQQYEALCNCGHRQQASFPQGVNAPIQYGHRLEALIGYLSVYQYMPYKRLADFLREVFGLGMSQGTVDNLLCRLKSKGLPFYEKIREGVAQSKGTVGGDETSCRVNGENHWAWVWQTPELCYLTISTNRGKATVEEHFPDGFQGTLSSDRWAAHLNTQAKAHQICLAHLLRELKYLEALEKSPFAVQLQELFRKAIHLKKGHGSLEGDSPKALSLETELNTLLQMHLPKDQCPETAKIQRSLIKLRGAVFPFLYDREIPPDNNASERAVRNIKVKMKVSGQFKSGQENFAVIRSVIDSVKKNAAEILEALVNMAKAQPNYAQN